jgi:EPS-associated MarR family transcriptional regulator
MNAPLAKIANPLPGAYCAQLVTMALSALQPPRAWASALPMTTDVHYKLMRVLEANPQMSQRDLARAMGISLGKVNYCLRTLIAKGWVKATNFTNSQRKAAYMYLLTPRGIDQKASLTVRFLHAKMQEYEALRAEIRQMRRETAGRSTVARAHAAGDTHLRRLRKGPL